MNFSAFHQFAVTSRASGPVVRVNHAAGLTRADFSRSVMGGSFGVTEKRVRSAGGCRGTPAGTNLEDRRA